MSLEIASNFFFASAKKKKKVKIEVTVFSDRALCNESYLCLVSKSKHLNVFFLLPIRLCVSTEETELSFSRGSVKVLSS